MRYGCIVRYLVVIGSIRIQKEDSVTYNIMQNRFFEIYNKDAPIDQFRTDTLITCRPKFKVIMSDKRIIKY